MTGPMKVWVTAVVAGASFGFGPAGAEPLKVATAVATSSASPVTTRFVAKSAETTPPAASSSMIRLDLSKLTMADFGDVDQNR